MNILRKAKSAKETQYKPDENAAPEVSSPGHGVLDIDWTSGSMGGETCFKLRLFRSDLESLFKDIMKHLMVPADEKKLSDFSSNELLEELGNRTRN